MKTQRMFDSQSLRTSIVGGEKQWDGELYLVDGGLSFP